ncbi:MAG: polyprenol monophosphomannose synthase [Elusimicrobia bacterium]|nr:polyprenol monophosphomannose synthase [Elusimicrobiota bacterium]
MEILAMIPTYNEAENIERMIKEILDLPLNIEVLVVDDFSPDGTYKLVENIMKNEKRVHLLLRKENRGRGFASIDGYKKALELGAKLILEMDGDGSHAPKYIPSIYEKMKTSNADIVSGSRFIEGGKDEDRPITRKIISAFAKKYLYLILGIKLKDPSSGFRLIKKEVLEKITPLLKAKDPFIITEVYFYAQKYAFKLAESPIEFFQRLAGTSKLDPLILIKYLFRVLKLRFSN